VQASEANSLGVKTNLTAVPSENLEVKVQVRQRGTTIAEKPNSEQHPLLTVASMSTDLIHSEVTATQVGPIVGQEKSSAAITV
jgi:hypothetical protein